MIEELYIIPVYVEVGTKYSHQYVFQFKLITENMIETDYPFINKYNKNEIFGENNLVENKNICILIYNEHIINNFLEEIRNIEINKFMN